MDQHTINERKALYTNLHESRLAGATVADCVVSDESRAVSIERQDDR
jgi:hypothetical protein